jgi:hypothetical protein
MDPPPSNFRTAKAIIKKARILFIDIDANNNKLMHLSTKVHVDAMAGKFELSSSRRGRGSCTFPSTIINGNILLTQQSTTYTLA